MGVIRENQSDYYLQNKELYNFHGAKRRAAKLDRTPCWLTDEALLLIADFYYLAKALTESSGVKYVVDHIIPLQGETVSGLHVPSNLQLLTEAENASKRNKFNPEEFNNGYS